MDSVSYKNFLLTNMRHATSASGGDEVACDCEYCPDKGQHMYISIPSRNDEPSLFVCFHCHTCGMVTHRRLMEWGIHDLDWNVAIEEHNRNVAANPINHLFQEFMIFNVNNNFIRDEDISYMKLNYINNRLGINFTFQDLLDNKIVLNLNDLLKSNYIKSYTRNINVINELNKNFLGFLSYDNGFVNLKKINDSSFIDDRYVNYNIFNKQDNTMKYFVIPTEIDLYNPNPIKVHLAEGPFDILSVKYNLRRDDNNCIYASVNGNSYKTIVRHILIYMKFINIELHIYQDNDTKVSAIRHNQNILNDLIQYIVPYGYKLYVHKNTIGKDMGVRLEEIKETIERVL